MFNVRNRVGLGDFAPKSPCAKSTKSNPGSCRKSCTIGNLQMDGLVSSSGSPGCSKTPRPSDRAKQISRSMEKRSNSFPTATWPCSRSESDGRPHSHSKDRKGRGWRPCSSPRSANRAWLQVSQGGPHRPPWTKPSSAPRSQNSLFSCLQASPHSGSITTSIDTT